jgi:hypothetical protein
MLGERSAFQEPRQDLEGVGYFFDKPLNPPQNFRRDLLRDRWGNVSHPPRFPLNEVKKTVISQKATKLRQLVGGEIGPPSQPIHENPVAGPQLGGAFAVSETRFLTSFVDRSGEVYVEWIIPQSNHGSPLDRCASNCGGSRSAQLWPFTLSPFLKWTIAALDDSYPYRGFYVKQGTPMATRSTNRQDLSLQTWKDYIYDYIQQRRITSEFFAACERLVRATARKYPPSLYSPLQVWDGEGDAYRTITTEVLAYQVRQGYLEKLYYANARSEVIQAYLRRAVKWQLISIAEARGANCLALLRRIRSLLNANRFCYFASLDGWGLREWTGRAWESVPEEVLVERLENLEVACPHHGRKRKNTTPGATELAVFVEALLKTFGRPLGLPEIVRSAQIHLGVYDAIECPWPAERDQESGEEEEPLEFPDPRSFAPEMEARDLIRDFCAKLNERDLDLLRGLFLNGHKQKHFVRPGFSKSSVSNGERRLKVLLRELHLDGEAIPYVVQIFEEILEERALRHEPHIFPKGSNPTG